jgi:hypothetical protein
MLFLGLTTTKFLYGFTLVVAMCKDATKKMYDIKDIVQQRLWVTGEICFGNLVLADSCFIYWFKSVRRKNYKKKFLKLLLKSNNITRHLRAKRTY